MSAEQSNLNYTTNKYLSLVEACKKRSDLENIYQLLSNIIEVRFVLKYNNYD
jgi:hypothetical protein